MRVMNDRLISAAEERLALARARKKEPCLGNVIATPRNGIGPSWLPLIRSYWPLNVKLHESTDANTRWS
jgi:hypothetical protein